MNDAVGAELNERLNQELQAAYLYFGLATYFEERDLPGFASWAKRQAQEELGHAQKVHEHLVSSRAGVRLGPIAEPPSGWGSPAEALTAALENERSLGEDYRSVLELVRREEEFLTEPLVLTFLTEQFEDEGMVDKLLQRVKLVGDDATGLLLLDSQLGGRPAS